MSRRTPHSTCTPWYRTPVCSIWTPIGGRRRRSSDAAWTGAGDRLHAFPIYSGPHSVQVLDTLTQDGVLDSSVALLAVGARAWAGVHVSRSGMRNSGGRNCMGVLNVNNVKFNSETRRSGIGKHLAIRDRCALCRAEDQVIVLKFVERQQSQLALVDLHHGFRRRTQLRKRGTQRLRP